MKFTYVQLYKLTITYEEKYENKKYIYAVIILTLFIFIYLNKTFAQIERFLPRQGGTTEICRITNDPTMRDWANYHNTDAWSPDDRYLCYVHQNPYMVKIPSSYEAHAPSEIYIYDLYKNKAVIKPTEVPEIHRRFVEAAQTEKPHIQK